jgi:hypothetical protein
VKGFANFEHWRWFSGFSRMNFTGIMLGRHPLLEEGIHV